MSESSILKKSSLNYNLITLILFWCGLIVMSSMYLTIPMISVFSSTLNVSSNVTAWTSTIFSIFFAIACLIYGPLSDQYGRKKIMLIGLGMLAVVSPLVGLYDNIYWVIALRAVQGLQLLHFHRWPLPILQRCFQIPRR